MSEIRPWYRWHLHRYETSKHVLEFCLSIDPLACHGCYRQLLDAMWKHAGYIPRKREIIWKLAGALSLSDYERVADMVESCFQVSEDGGSFYSQTLLEEWDSATEILEKRRAAGKLGGQRKSQAYAKAKPKQKPSTPLPSSSSSSSSSTEAKSKTFCTEPLQASVPAGVYALPLNDNSNHPITQAEIDQWAGLYPAVDVMQQLRSMAGWLISNPTKRKTKRGINHFINSWLTREQDRPHAERNGNGRRKTLVESIRDSEQTAL